MCHQEYPDDKHFERSRSTFAPPRIYKSCNHCAELHRRRIYRGNSDNIFLENKTDEFRRCPQCRIQRLETDFMRSNPKDKSPTPALYARATCNLCAKSNAVKAKLKEKVLQASLQASSDGEVRKLCKVCHKVHPESDFIRQGKSFKTCKRCIQDMALFRKNRRECADPNTKLCGRCKRLHPIVDFTRRGRVWKLCNHCIERPRLLAQASPDTIVPPKPGVLPNWNPLRHGFIGAKRHYHVATSSMLPAMRAIRPSCHLVSINPSKQLPYDVDGAKRQYIVGTRFMLRSTATRRSQMHFLNVPSITRNATSYSSHMSVWSPRKIYDLASILASACRRAKSL